VWRGLREIRERMADMRPGDIVKYGRWGGIDSSALRRRCGVEQLLHSRDRTARAQLWKRSTHSRVCSARSCPAGTQCVLCTRAECNFADSRDDVAREESIYLADADKYSSSTPFEADPAVTPRYMIDTQALSHPL
jgi:hypothetical protein